MNVLVFIIAALSACAGYGLAMVLNYWAVKSTRAKARAELESARIDADVERSELQQFVGTVQQVAAGVQGSMTRHTTHVVAFSEEVVQNVAGDPKAMLKATKRLLQANVELQEELVAAREQITAKQRELDVYMSDARTDALTGVANRRVFDQEIRRLISQNDRTGTRFSLLLADIDHFKWFNDYHGHQTGDEMLRLVAKCFTRTLRGMDLVCRYGGEEFGLILPETSLKDAIRVAERACKAVERILYKAEDVDLNVTISIGVAAIIQGEGLEKLIRRSDQALYAAKNAGRNCAFYHDGHQPEASSVPVLVENFIGFKSPTETESVDSVNDDTTEDPTTDVDESNDEEPALSNLTDPNVTVITDKKP